MNRLVVVVALLIAALLSVVAAGYGYDNSTRNARVAAQAVPDTTTLQVLGNGPNAHDSDDALEREEAPGLGVDDGIVDGMTTAEQNELVQLRRDKRRLEQEVEVLRRATAYFAKDAAPK